MDEEDVEELDLTSGKNHDDTSHRSAIMRQLINDLCLINDFERNFSQRHPFSTLDVILEEVTPSTSKQQLENIKSAIKTDHCSEYCEFDSDSSNSKNMYRRQGSSSDQSSASGITTARSVNDSNTSNIDVQNSDRSKEKKRKTTDENDESSPSGDRQKVYNKYEHFINDDTRYIHKDSTSTRSKFLTLNKKYERDQAKQSKQKKYKNHIYKTDSFHCLNAYAVKRETQNNMTKEIDYNLCSVEELENRLKYFEKQIQNLQNEFKSQRSEDETKEDNTSEREISNRGDYKSHSNLKSSSEPTPSYTSKSSEPTVIIVDADKVQHINKTIKASQSTSPTIIISKSSEYPKVMYASSSKNVSTQVEDTDWKKICNAKKELSDNGSLRISLPNSIDDNSGEPISHRRREYDSYSTDVNFRSECASQVVSQRTVLEQSQETVVLNIPEISSESKLSWLCCGKGCRKK